MAVTSPAGFGVTRKREKLEKYPWRSKSNTKRNTPPWVFFTFFKLYKCYQIAQCIIFYDEGRFAFEPIKPLVHIVKLNQIQANQLIGFYFEATFFLTF